MHSWMWIHSFLSKTNPKISKVLIITPPLSWWKGRKKCPNFGLYIHKIWLKTILYRTCLKMNCNFFFYQKLTRRKLCNCILRKNKSWYCAIYFYLSKSFDLFTLSIYKWRYRGETNQTIYAFIHYSNRDQCFCLYDYFV